MTLAKTLEKEALSFQSLPGQAQIPSKPSSQLAANRYKQNSK